jgi:hypothetical protein
VCKTASDCCFFIIILILQEKTFRYFRVSPPRPRKIRQSDIVKKIPNRLRKGAYRTSKEKSALVVAGGALRT